MNNTIQRIFDEHENTYFVDGITAITVGADTLCTDKVTENSQDTSLDNKRQTETEKLSPDSVCRQNTAEPAVKEIPVVKLPEKALRLSVLPVGIPGCGKTRVLTEFIEHLCKNGADLIQTNSDVVCKDKMPKGDGGYEDVVVMYYSYDEAYVQNSSSQSESGGATQEPTNATDKPAEKPADKPIEEHAEEPIEKPAEEPIEKPAEEPIEKPAEETKKETTEISAEDRCKEWLKDARDPLSKVSDLGKKHVILIVDKNWNARGCDVSKNLGSVKRCHKLSVRYVSFLPEGDWNDKNVFTDDFVRQCMAKAWRREDHCRGSPGTEIFNTVLRMAEQRRQDYEDFAKVLQKKDVGIRYITNHVCGVDTSGVEFPSHAEFPTRWGYKKGQIESEEQAQERVLEQMKPFEPYLKGCKLRYPNLSDVVTEMQAAVLQ